MTRVKLKSATAKDILEILNKQWLSANDIKMVASVGKNKADEIRKEIQQELKEKKYFYPSYMVPSEFVVKKLGLNINYLRKMAKEEKNEEKIKTDLEESLV